MIVINTQAIVLKSVRYKDNDLILTLFTRKLGKISAIAKGAKKSKSPLLSSSQVFSYSNYTLKKQNDIYRVVQTDVIKSFYDIAYDIEAFSYATYILKLVEKSMFENQTNNRLFLLLAKTLNFYTNKDIDKYLLTRIFELQFIDYLGFKPILNKCVICTSTKNISRFNVYEGGVICEECSKNSTNTILLDVTTIRLMEYILSNDIDICVRAKVSKYILYEFENIIRKYLKVHLENINLSSLYLIKDINNYKGDDDIG